MLKKIVFNGDSLTAALEVPYATDRWPYRVGIHNGYAPADIINKGKSGRHSNQMVLDFHADVMSYASEIDVLAMMFTVNDKTNGIMLAQSKANYINMITQAQNAGIQVVLLTPNLYTSNLPSWVPWLDMWDEIAAETGCVLIDVWREFVWQTYVRSDWFSYYYADYAHTNTNGNALIYFTARKKMHEGAFLKAQPAEPQQPSDSSELVLSLADLVANGATATRLQRALNAING